jgi:hypothetical protein
VRLRKRDASSANISETWHGRVRRYHVTATMPANTCNFQPLLMLETNLRVLQLNIMKLGPRMEALINNY